MSLGLQLGTLWSSPNFLAAVAVLLVIVCQTWHEKRKRVLQGKAPMVSHLIPWVGSAFEVAKDPDAFFERARWVTPDIRLCVAAQLNLLIGKNTVTYLP